MHLEYDSTERDQYDRRLAYVWFEREGEVYMVNEAMVRGGWAVTAPFEPDVRYQEQIAAAEQFSMDHQLGVHDLCEGFDSPPEPTSTPPPHPDSTASNTGSDCDPSYPGVCILPQWQVGDLECGDITERRFEVLPPDLHRFDGNNDGVGCESD